MKQDSKAIWIPCHAGYLPIHYACIKNPRIVKECQDDKDGSKKKKLASYLYRLVKLLVSKDPATLREPCGRGLMPVHYAALNGIADYNTMHLMIRTCPEALLSSFRLNQA